MTCGRSGVGSITSIDLLLNGTTEWDAEWLEITFGSQITRFEVNHTFVAYEARQFFRNGLQINMSKYM